MAIKADSWIRRMALEEGMIEPFVDGQVREGVISYGLSSYGYDIRVADEFKIFQPEITANKLSDVQCAYVAGAIDGLGHIGYSLPAAMLAELDIVVATALEKEPGYLDALLALGDLYREQDDMDNARLEYEEIVALNPGVAVGYMRLGALANELGDEEEAERYLDAARQAEPGSVVDPDDAGEDSEENGT